MILSVLVYLILAIITGSGVNWFSMERLLTNRIVQFDRRIAVIFIYILSTTV
jgi:hypothetical protein